MLLFENISIVIPAYNEDEGIRSTLTKLMSIPEIQNAEIIVVDDGSTDNTIQTASEYPVKVLCHRHNKGYGAALKTGIRKAIRDYIVIMDSDGQHDPTYITALVKELETCDMVIGERTEDSYQVKSRSFGKRLIRIVGEYLVEQRLPDYNSGFRGFNKELIEKMLHIMPNGFSFSTTSTMAFIKEGYQIGTIPIKVEEREGRSSNVSFLKDGTKTILLLTRVIMLFNPLKIFLPVSLLISILGFLWGSLGFLEVNRFSNAGVFLMVIGSLIFLIGLLADQISLLNRK